MKLSALGTVALSLLSVSSFAADLLTNPGFESGAMGPWYQSLDYGATTPWGVTSDDAHTGTFSATNVGNSQIRQDFTPTATSLITEVSFWIKNPEVTLNAVVLHYSDFSEGTVLFWAPNGEWNHVDVTSSLEAGKTLVAIGVWGYGGGGPAEDRTYVDDFVVTAVPEPASMVALGLGVVAALRRRKKS